MEIPKSIAGALVKAQRAAKSVEKSSANAFHKYRYASAEAVITEGRAALGEAGLALICTGWAAVDGSGKAEAAGTHVSVGYVLVHEGGDSWQMDLHVTPVLEEKARPLDKAQATALTYSLGYTLRGLLCLARVEEGTDVDQRDDREHEPQPKAPTLAERLAGLTTKAALVSFVGEHQARLRDTDPAKSGPLLVACAKRLGLDEAERAKMEATIWPPE